MLWSEFLRNLSLQFWLVQKELLYIPFGIGICFRVKGGFWEGQAYVRFLEETYLLMDCVMVKSRENGEL